MTRYSDEVIHEMYERAKQKQKRLYPLYYKFRDMTIKEIQKELESKNSSQEDQTDNK